MVVLNNENYLSDRSDSKTLPASGKVGEQAKEVVTYSVKALDSFATRHPATPATDSLEQLVQTFLKDQEIHSLLLSLADLRIFSHEIHLEFREHLIVLGGLKQIKYFFNLPLGHLLVAFEPLTEMTSTADWWAKFRQTMLKSDIAKVKTGDYMDANGIKDYASWLEGQVTKDPHSVYPTSIYRQCDGVSLATQDFSTIESVMRNTVSTTVKIKSNVLSKDEPTLAGIYKPLARCVALVDSKVEGIYGRDIDAYFRHHSIPLVKLVYRGDEVDKAIGQVENILVDMKNNGMARNEPLLVIGGGVISDIGGFATALYHRATPYVMLATSLVAGIDAGPSPRKGCDGHGFKNLYGAYHPPSVTLVDRQFFKTLHEAWIRHGISEIIKMGVTKDRALFELVEKAGTRLITTKFGTIMDSPDPEFESLCDLIVGKAIEAYVKSEYKNCWETHQIRPHAFGHTWSPGYELPSGLLHGQAVSTGMGFGAYLARRNGWIEQTDFERILKLLSSLGLALYHPIMDNTDLLYKTQIKVVEKRGGRLCAPVPRGGLGLCGFINDVSFEELKSGLSEYKAVAQTYPRTGLGIEMHCVEVGLSDPKASEALFGKDEQQNGHTENGNSSMLYSEFIKTKSKTASNVSSMVANDTAEPPVFNNVQLCHKGVEEYAMEMSTPASTDLQQVAGKTVEKNMFTPCMVGSVESQFLKMVVKMVGAKLCLDIGTFTGMSALALADAVGKSGKVFTLEVDEASAEVAQANFDASPAGSRIQLVRKCALKAMNCLKREGHKFDLVFLDGAKEEYMAYYDAVMDGDLLSEKGVIVADNTLSALVYDEGDVRRQRLHEFNQRVKNDSRVEQVVLSVREGITMIKRV